MGEGGRYRCESEIDTGERLGKMQVRGGGRYGYKMEAMTSERRWWIWVCDGGMSFTETTLSVCYSNEWNKHKSMTGINNNVCVRLTPMTLWNVLTSTNGIFSLLRMGYSHFSS